uniref:Zinc finger protein 830 n=1 Tax=Lygus hesperus TaxID=30085 RepID=A0A0A9Y6Q5_LYGHE
MTSVKKKVSQNDLRVLMSLQKRKAKDSQKKIESPLAKYSSSGVLSCIVCDSVVRSEAVWNVHINSKQHRENIAKKKSPSIPPPAPISVDVTKLIKRPAPEVFKVPEDVAPPKKLRGILKNAPPVPEGFFDDIIVSPSTSKVPETAASVSNGEQEPMEMENIDEGSAATELPEGFFDNPVLDAKARNVEYKDPIQEEWDRFQKEIKEETTVSAQIIYDDTEDATAQRQIEEIDEQLRKLSKVVELDHKREKVKANVLSKPVEIKEEEMSSDEGEDFEIEFDWRAKRYLC